MTTKGDETMRFADGKKQTQRNPLGLDDLKGYVIIFPESGGNSSGGRAPAFQAGCRGFESRFPLHCFCGALFAFLSSPGTRGEE